MIGTAAVWLDWDNVILALDPSTGKHPQPAPLILALRLLLEERNLWPGYRRAYTNQRPKSGKKALQEAGYDVKQVPTGRNLADDCIRQDILRIFRHCHGVLLDYVLISGDGGMLPVFREIQNYTPAPRLWVVSFSDKLNQSFYDSDYRVVLLDSYYEKAKKILAAGKLHPPRRLTCPAGWSQSPRRGRFGIVH